MFKVDKKLSNQIIALTKTARCNSLYISGNNYFVKKDENLKEYLGYKLAKLCGLKCIEYNVININDTFYIISRDINETMTFTSAHPLIGAYHELSLIINDLKKLPYTTSNTIQDLLKMYLFDLLFLNGDRHNRNWGLININGEYRVLIFDNENIFSLLFLPYICFNLDNFSNPNKNYTSRICDDLSAFLKKCPKEYLEELYKIIDKSEPSNVSAIINSIETINNTKLNPRFLPTYTTHYNKIKDVVLEHITERRAR